MAPFTLSFSLSSSFWFLLLISSVPIRAAASVLLPLIFTGAIFMVSNRPFQHINAHHAEHSIPSFHGGAELNGVAAAFKTIVNNFSTFMAFHYVNFRRYVKLGSFLLLLSSLIKWASVTQPNKMQAWTRTNVNRFFFARLAIVILIIPENYGLIMNEIDPINFFLQKWFKLYYISIVKHRLSCYARKKKRDNSNNRRRWERQKYYEKIMKD